MILIRELAKVGSFIKNGYGYNKVKLQRSSRNVDESVNKRNRILARSAETDVIKIKFYSAQKVMMVEINSKGLKFQTVHGRPDLIARFEYLQAGHRRCQPDFLTIMRRSNV
ncbi:MAG: hypothetical protein ACI9P5_003592 [Saprospiraceae bacterium]|jgi:hypothetical protein